MERNYQVADESDPYAQTDAVLKEKGAFYENQLVQGEYVVGVHIPEGKYTIELMEGIAECRYWTWNIASISMSFFQKSMKREQILLQSVRM